MPPCPAGSITLSSDKLLSGGYTAPIAVNVADGTYRVTLVSVDPFHAAGYQTEQTQETWRLDGLDASFQVVYSSGSTQDIPENTVTVATVVDQSGTFSGVVWLRARHTGSTQNPNSVMPHCVVLTPI